jgi:nickel-type superoxide dismutase maturation protease
MREAGWKDRILLLLGRLDTVRVSGDSMLPSLNDGDVVLVARSSRVDVGNVVLADHPFKNITVLKRVTAIDRDGRFQLLGDNPDESSDSRSFGNIARETIRGKVVCRLKRR